MKFKNKKRVPLAICLTALGFSSTGFLDAQTIGSASAKVAQANNEQTEFLRLTKDADGEPLAMQTAVTRYRPKEGNLVVDLIGAVHIGEAEYYEQLNRQFEVYDVVLYELVAPQGTRIPAGGKREAGVDSPLDIVSWMQQQAKSSLGLESQLEKIDYQKSNLIHADMSPTDMGEKMAERGESALTIGLSAMSEILKQQNQAASSPANKELLSQFADESIFELFNNPLKLKRMMASQFANSGVMDMGLGKTLNQLLVTDRNAAALKVMQKEIAAGKTKIAIFYGAAHLPDFERRLTEDFGLTKTKQVWVDAWDLTHSNVQSPKSSATEMFFNLLNEMSK